MWSDPIVPTNANELELIFAVSAAATAWFRNVPVTLPKDCGLLEVKDAGSVRMMLRVKPVPPIVPLTFASGNWEGRVDAVPLPGDAFGTIPVAATW
jgi:hypothetical protein